MERFRRKRRHEKRARSTVHSCRIRGNLRIGMSGLMSREWDMLRGEGGLGESSDHWVVERYQLEGKVV